MALMHVNKNAGIIRFYADGKSFENCDTFICSISFMELSPKTVYLYNAVGRMTSDNYKLIKAEMVNRGFHQVLAYLPTKYIPDGFASSSETDLHQYDLKADF